MSVSINNIKTSAQAHKNFDDKNNKQTFTGSFNPVVAVMDGIEKGGFAASFIVQDGVGMVGPRIWEGLNRNRPKDENGNKTGPLNWEFARREALREILSGPSAFLIPLGMMSFIKKFSGTANNVHVDHIEALGQKFVSYATENPNTLNDINKFKKGYYAKVFENTLQNSLEEALPEAELKTKAKDFADRLIDIETKRAAKDKKGANKIEELLIDEFIDLRKAHNNSSINELGAKLSVEGKKNGLQTGIKRLLRSLTDYTGDAFEKTNKHLAKNSQADIGEFIQSFNKRRAGTRVLSNIGMWSAVVGFYAIIPKLYNLGLKGDPGLKGLEDTSKNKDISFTGNPVQSLGKTAMQEGGISKLFKKFEFNDASMSTFGMLSLLFGFCLPTRYKNAKSNKERKEILVRDIASFGAILFGAKALSRGFSVLFTKISGFALNIKPQNHNNIFRKLLNYLTPADGIQVLSSKQIVNKYSNLKQYKDGINGFIDYIQNNNGNVKKVLVFDKTVKINTEKILKEFNGKSLKDATIEEIKTAFTNANGSEELEKIYKVFASKDNKFVTKAKTLNSIFGFVSTILLVPIFMMWLAKYCENMTKKAVTKELEEKAKLQAKEAVIQTPPPPVLATSKPSMKGFLNNKKTI